METYKKLSEYDVRTILSMSDLFPTLVDNGDGTYSNKNVPLSAIRTYSAVPTGGTTNQALTKVSSTDYATQWSTIDKTFVGLPNVDNTSDVNKPVSTAVTAAIAAAVSTTKAALYPVGSIYTNATDSTNPGTLLGFGTWTAFATGRVPVGVGTSDIAFTAGATGGESSHVLTAAEQPSVTGNITMHNAAGYTNVASVSGAFSASIAPGQYSSPPFVGNVGSVGAYNFNNGGAGTAHNNLQPYVVVYMWRRTA